MEADPNDNATRQHPKTSFTSFALGRWCIDRFSKGTNTDKARSEYLRFVLLGIIFAQCLSPVAHEESPITRLLFSESPLSLAIFIITTIAGDHFCRDRDEHRHQHRHGDGDARIRDTGGGVIVMMVVMMRIIILLPRTPS